MARDAQGVQQARRNAEESREEAERGVDETGDRLAGAFARAGDIPSSMVMGLERIVRAEMRRYGKPLATDAASIGAGLEEGERLLRQLEAAGREVRKAEVARRSAVFGRSGIEQRQRDSLFDTEEMRRAFAETNAEVGKRVRECEQAWAAWEQAAAALQRKCVTIVLSGAEEFVTKPEPDEDGRWT